MTLGDATWIVRCAIRADRPPFRRFFRVGDSTMVAIAFNIVAPKGNIFCPMLYQIPFLGSDNSINLHLWDKNFIHKDAISLI